MKRWEVRRREIDIKCFSHNLPQRGGVDTNTCYYGDKIITLLINVAPQNITVGCWEFTLNLILCITFQASHCYIIRAHITRVVQCVMLWYKWYIFKSRSFVWAGSLNISLYINVLCYEWMNKTKNWVSSMWGHSRHFVSIK